MIQCSNTVNNMYKLWWSQAVIYLIDGDIESAKKYYKDFQDIRSQFYSPDTVKEGSPLYGVVHKFEVFEKIGNNLKIEIEDAHKTKQVDLAKS